MLLQPEFSADHEVLACWGTHVQIEREGQPRRPRREEEKKDIVLGMASQISSLDCCLGWPPLSSSVWGSTYCVSTEQ